jgi:kynureninase
MQYLNSLEFAKQMDLNDPLRKFRDKFYFPKHNGKETVYFCGNSLGLQPKTARNYIEKEIKNWEEHGVEGHFKSDDPWFNYHEVLKETSARIVGALPSEVVMMNTLTVNLHLLMVSFYRPTKEKFKIICEAGAFPSDQYALESQVKFHGFSPEDAIIELKPRDGENLLRTEDIIKVLDEQKDQLALVLIGGVNYYTGQLYDMKTITEAGHKNGAVVGFDLAHAAGNVELSLHDWNVDFAVWCTYKYLNSGPGGIAGAFVNEKHAQNNSLPRFAGWWGNDPKTRFKMERGFSPAFGADGWQLSNCPIFPMASLRASLDIFEEAGMHNLSKKRDLLTGYLEFIVKEINSESPIKLNIISPSNKEERGAQLSITIDKEGKRVFNELLGAGVIGDWREPNVIRIAPVPLYNSFEDVYNFGRILEKILS